MLETITEFLRYTLPLVILATAGLASYNINRLALLSPGARGFLIAVTALVSAPMMVAPFFFPVPVLARAVLAYLMLLACIGCWALVAIARPGMEALVIIEEEFSQLRDVSVLGGTQLRAELVMVQERLKKRAEPPDHRLELAALLKSASPLVMLFFAKERSALKWGMTALGFGRQLKKYYDLKNPR